MQIDKRAADNKGRYVSREESIPPCFAIWGRLDTKNSQKLLALSIDEC